MKSEDIIKAYIRIREIDNTIPDEVLDFMKQSALQRLAAPSPSIDLQQAPEPVEDENRKLKQH